MPKWYEAPVDVQEQVVGQGRMGARLASLIATLRTVMRLPIRQIQYFEHHHSRGGEVVKELIGKDFGGVLGSDFSAGYNSHEGLHQRGSGAVCTRCP